MEPAKALGASEFFDFVLRESPQWALAAVDAPIDAVTPALVKRHRPDGWEPDVGKKPVAPARKPCFVLQLRGHPWCLVLRTLAWVDAESAEQVREDARALSKRLETRALAFTGQGAAGPIRYGLYREGLLVEAAEWEGEELTRFHSTLRGRPKGPLVPRVMVDGLCREHGLYLPTCSLDTDGGQLWLSLADLPVSAVARADFLALR